MYSIKDKLRNSLFFLFTTTLLVSCHEPESYKVDFYRSQPRDQELPGWWEYYNTDTKEYTYTVFQNDATRWDYSYHDGELWKNSSFDYWYTEGGKIWTYYYIKNWFYGSKEHSISYRIENDVLIMYDDTYEWHHTRCEPKE